jgi:hypothetical protein
MPVNSSMIRYRDLTPDEKRASAPIDALAKSVSGKRKPKAGKAGSKPAAKPACKTKQ